MRHAEAQNPESRLDHWIHCLNSSGNCNVRYLRSSCYSFLPASTPWTWPKEGDKQYTGLSKTQTIIFLASKVNGSSCNNLKDIRSLNGNEDYASENLKITISACLFILRFFLLARSVLMKKYATNGQADASLKRAQKTKDLLLCVHVVVKT